MVQSVKRPVDTDALTRPPAEILDAAAQRHTKGLLRRLGVAADMIPDLVQDTVTAAFLALHHKGSALPVPAEHEPRWSRLHRFLAGIARHHVSHARRRVRRGRELPPDLRAQGELVDCAATDKADPEQRASGAQQREILLWVLAQLPPEQNEILTLLAIEELTMAEIALKQGVSENTVKSRLARARSHAKRVIRSLPVDKRRLLEGSSAAVLLGFCSRAEAHAAPPRPRGLGAGACVLAAGIAVSGGPAGTLDHAHAASALDNQPAVTTPALSTPEVPAAEGAKAPITPATAMAAPLRRPASWRKIDTLPAEQVLIGDARRALAAGTYSLALLAIATHSQRYPSGKLAGVREELKTELRARVRAHVKVGR